MKVKHNIVVWEPVIEDNSEKLLELKSKTVNAISKQLGWQLKIY